jgi:uncharacterized membrane protein YhiD involved in acid resistance
VNSVPLNAEMFLRLLVAILLGALIGYEREPTGKPANVQTHRTVSIVAATQTRLPESNGVGEVETLRTLLLKYLEV